MRVELNDAEVNFIKHLNETIQRYGVKGYTAKGQQYFRDKMAPIAERMVQQEALEAYHQRCKVSK